MPQLIIINLLAKQVMKQKKSFDKFAFAVFINNTDFDKKVATLATKAELIAEQGKLVKIWFTLFLLQKSFWWWHSKLFSVSANG